MWCDQFKRINCCTAKIQFEPGIRTASLTKQWLSAYTFTEKFKYASCLVNQLRKVTQTWNTEYAVHLQLTKRIEKHMLHISSGVHPRAET